MGLDITAHRKMQKIDCVFDADGEPIDLTTREGVEYDSRPYVNPDFPGRQGRIEDRAVYKSDEDFRFRAGSYSGYNCWRDDLAKMAGWPLGSYEQYGREWSSHAASAWAASEGPFLELIWFSDCEGVIGAEVSAKLAKDFAEYQSKADAHPEEYFRAKYAEWRKAFEMASDDGAVIFS